MRLGIGEARYGRNRVSSSALLGKTRYLTLTRFLKETRSRSPTNQRNRVSSSGLFDQTRYLRETRFLKETRSRSTHKPQKPGFFLKAIGKNQISQRNPVSQTNPIALSTGFLLQHCWAKPDISEKPGF
ncbi:MAG: hypothetical protein RLZZ338_2192 [Cyanobacteriota bacterium]